MVFGMEQTPMLVLPEPLLDSYHPTAEQARVLTALAARNSVGVLGAAGTVKSRVALQALADFDGEGQAVFLTPTRARADQLLDEATAISARGIRPVRTPASLAFAILAGHGAPTLLTGSDEQALVAELIAHTDWPDIVPAESLALEAFQNEVRSFLARAGEFDISAEQVRQWNANPLWETLAGLLQEYQDRLDQLGLVDSARAQRKAADVLAKAGSPYSLVLIDDCQDMTHASGALIRALAQGGATVGLFANPDVAVESYRGGDHLLPARLMEELSLRPCQLTRQQRSAAQVVQVSQRFVQGIGTSGISSRENEAQPYKKDLPCGVRLRVSASFTDEVLQVANMLRTEHLLHGTPWQEMAVICRSEALADSWRQMLSGRGVPLAATSRPLALGLDPITSNLARLLQVEAQLQDMPEAPAALGLIGQKCLQILRSPLMGVDSLAWIALSRHFQGDPHQELAKLVSDPLLAKSFSTALKDFAAHRYCEPLLRMAHAIAQVRAEQGISTRLWAAWQGIGVADEWAKAALADSKYDDYLDAALALFRFADVYTQRNPEASESQFLQEVLEQTLPTDHLAVAGQRPAGVRVATAAALAGMHYQVVAIVGVNQDVWPDMRMRDSFLGAGLLADLAKGRASFGNDGKVMADPDPFTSIRYDEARMFACALSRASRFVLVTATSDTDAGPSAFMTTLLSAGAQGSVDPEGNLVTDPGASALDLRGYVGTLRHDAIEGDQDAVALLGYLAAQGVPAANPQYWSAGPISTDSPLVLPGQLVTVSPSSLEAALDCPLKWLLTQHGGNPPSSGEQQLGTLIHQIAYEHPEADLQTLEAALAAKIDSLELPDTFWGRLEVERAYQMVRKLAMWFADGRELVKEEAEFRQVVGEVRLRGSIDRVERTEDGNIAIVDFKTGRTPKSAKEVKENPQLAAYQVAYQAMTGKAIETAQLVYLGADGDKYKARSQDGIGEDTASFAHELVAMGATAMRGPAYQAVEGTGCRTCPVKSSCPAMTEGKKLL